MNIVYRTGKAWAELFGDVILDADGWNNDTVNGFLNYRGSFYTLPITEEEYQKRLAISTVSNLHTKIKED